MKQSEYLSMVHEWRNPSKSSLSNWLARREMGRLTGLLPQTGRSIARWDVQLSPAKIVFNPTERNSEFPGSKIVVDLKDGAITRTDESRSRFDHMYPLPARNLIRRAWDDYGSPADDAIIRHVRTYRVRQHWDNPSILQGSSNEVGLVYTVNDECSLPAYPDYRHEFQTVGFIQVDGTWRARKTTVHSADANLASWGRYSILNTDSWDSLFSPMGKGIRPYVQAQIDLKGRRYTVRNVAFGVQRMVRQGLVA